MWKWIRGFCGGFSFFGLSHFGLCHSPWYCVNIQSWPVSITASISPLCSGFSSPLSPYSHHQLLQTSVVFKHSLSWRIKVKKTRNGADITLLWMWYDLKTPTHIWIQSSFSPLAYIFPHRGLGVKSCVISLLAKHMAGKSVCRLLPLQWLCTYSGITHTSLAKCFYIKCSFT